MAPTVTFYFFNLLICFESGNICSQNCPNESQYGFAHYEFLIKSHDLKISIKPRRCSLYNMRTKTLDYVITLHQVHLSKTTKHWDSFVSHCSYASLPSLLPVSTPDSQETISKQHQASSPTPGPWEGLCLDFQGCGSVLSWERQLKQRV